MTSFEMVQEFQRKFNCHMDMTNGTDLGTHILKAVAQTIRREAGYLHAAAVTKDGMDNRIMRARLTVEEVAEFLEALADNDRVQIAKEAADVHYTVHGLEDAYGIPADRTFAAVHASNMTKTEVRDSGGKILKGPDYVAPNIDAILKEAV